MLRFWKLVFLYFCRLSSAWNIEIMTTLSYNFSVDVASTRPAFDVAVKNAQQIYGPYLNITMKYLYNPSHRNCDDVASQTVQMIAEHIYADRKPVDCYALVTTGCGDTTGVASLAREFDWLLFGNSYSTNNFLNPNIGSPTAIALMGTYVGYAQILLDILSLYAWYHVTIILEAKAVSPFYKGLASQLLVSARRHDELFALEQVLLESNSSSFALRAAKQRSRILVLLTLGKTAVILLKTARQEGMANGDYVFLNVQPSQIDEYGTTSQFAHPSNDTDTVTLFRSLLFITFRPATNDLSILNKEIIARSHHLYSDRTMVGGSSPLSLPPIQSSYDIVDLFAQAFNESKQKGRTCSGLRMAHRMSNRTLNITTGETYITPERSRNLDLSIFGFNTSTMSMQVVGTYIWAGRHLEWSADLHIDWPTTDGLPPADIPLCGFTGNERSCDHQGRLLTLTVAVGMTACAMILTALLSRYVKTVLGRPIENWWLLENHRLFPKQHYATFSWGKLIRGCS